MQANCATWGAVFDWDGVVVDSSAYHEKSWDILAAEEGLVLPEGHFKRGFGMKNEAIIPQVLKWATAPEEVVRLARKKEEAYRSLVRSGGMESLPGVREFLVALKDQEIPAVVASSTERANIECALDTIGLREFFADIVSGDDVTHGKPDPEVFLIAAERIGRTAERCVVFEDAQVGIQAARAAGMKVIAVTTTHSAEELDHTDLVVDRLDELTPGVISTWFADE